MKTPIQLKSQQLKDKNDTNNFNQFKSLKDNLL
jgi:hypothetical protein